MKLYILTLLIAVQAKHSLQHASPSDYKSDPSNNSWNADDGYTIRHSHPSEDSKSLTQRFSIPACNSAEGCKTGFAFETDKTKEKPIVVYPNHGLDNDIKTSQDNLKNAEAKLGKWDLPKQTLG